ncbi:hypothetical protein Trydic_g367 [Trypoxylus dichotomus]
MLEANGASIIFASDSKAADYHSAMDSRKFEEWVTKQLIPSLPLNSLVIMDNTPYHSAVTNKIPNTLSRKHDIADWLTNHNISFSRDVTKLELLDTVKRNNPETNIIRIRSISAEELYHYPDNFSEKIIEELNDSKQREGHILIFNLAESPKADRVEWLREDKAMASTTLPGLETNCVLNDINVVRFRFYNQDIFYPVKITLYTSDDVLKLLKAKRDKSLKLVSISADWTMRQIEYLKNLRLKLNELNDQVQDKIIKTQFNTERY